MRVALSPDTTFVLFFFVYNPVGIVIVSVVVAMVAACTNHFDLNRCQCRQSSLAGTSSLCPSRPQDLWGVCWYPAVCIAR